MSAQGLLPFGRLNTPIGVFGDVLSDLIAGSSLQPHLVSVFYSAFATSWFTSVSQAYDIKSAGGEDELGVIWPDLKPATKAYSRKELRVGVPLPNISPHRPTLTEAQNNAWKDIYLSQLSAYPSIADDYTGVKQQAFSFLVQIEDERRAHSRAASYAWAEVKSRYGAKTLLEIIGTKQAEILKDTLRLRKSYEPSGGAPYNPSPDQVFQPRLGGLALGSKMPYSKAVTRRRPVMPRGPNKWARKALLDGLNAIRQNMDP